MDLHGGWGGEGGGGRGDASPQRGSARGRSARSPPFGGTAVTGDEGGGGGGGAGGVTNAAVRGMTKTTAASGEAW